MTAAAFPSPTSEMAEMSRIHYELEYTEGISQQMRIPEMLKVGGPYAGSSGGPYGSVSGGPYGSGSGDLEDTAGSQKTGAMHSAMMQVPERIVVAGDSEDSQFARPRDLDLIQSTVLESLALKTPPRVLTLSERPLDFMETERSAAPAPHSEETPSQGRLRRERSVSENMGVRYNGQSNRHDSSFALSTLDTTLDVAQDDMAVVDAATLRRQIIKLNRRLQLLEEENKERTKREMVMYSITVAFWLINSWVWFRR